MTYEAWKSGYIVFLHPEIDENDEHEFDRYMDDVDFDTQEAKIYKSGYERGREITQEAVSDVLQAAAKKWIKIRIKIGDQTDNWSDEHNLYDSAGPFASWLVIWELEFNYDYQNAECVFNIMDKDRFMCLVESEKPDVEFDVLE